MAYTVKDLMFHFEVLEVEDQKTPQAALKVKNKGQEVAEIVFNCGRTVGANGTTDVIEEAYFNELLDALRKKLKEL